MQKKVLVYRVGSLGDTLVALPAFHLVRRRFPDAEITLLTNIPVAAKAAPMEAILGGTGLVDRVLTHPIRLRDAVTVRRLHQLLSAEKFETLVYLASPRGGLLRSLRDALFFWSCGIRRLVGFPIRKRELRSAVDSASGLWMSESERILECLKALGSAELSKDEWWDLRLRPEEESLVDTLLADAGLDSSFIALSIGTKVDVNHWGEKNWKKLLERLTAQHGDLGLVVLGAPEEYGACETLLRVWNGPKANLCGAAEPRVSAAILKRSLLFLGHDSGPMHLAATVGTRCIAIFSARNLPGIWFPRGRGHRVFYRKITCYGCGLDTCSEYSKQCILSISVDEVAEAIQEELKHKWCRKTVCVSRNKDQVESGNK